MSKSKLHKSLQIIALAVAVQLPRAIQAQTPTDLPPAAPATQRSAEAILDEYQRLNEQVRSLVQSPDELLDPARRAQIAQTAVPELKKLLALADELSTAGAMGKQFSPQLRSGVDSVLAVFNDPDAIARLEAIKKTGDANDAVVAHCALLFGDWVRSDGDATRQSALLDQVETLAKGAPEDDNLAVLLLQFSEAGPANEEIRNRARTIATTTLTGEMAQQIRQQMDADAKLAALVGQPLVIEGKRHTGEAFTSADWKGKLVLVDFAVSAWPPSRDNIARLKKLHADYHAKGLEIVTVCCDETADDLRRFISENGELAWPILFDTENPGWHALAKQLNVTDPSTAILIGRDGNVVSVDARVQLESLISRHLNP